MIAGFVAVRLRPATRLYFLATLMDQDGPRAQLEFYGGGFRFRPFKISSARQIRASSQSLAKDFSGPGDPELVEGTAPRALTSGPSDPKFCEQMHYSAHWTLKQVLLALLRHCISPVPACLPVRGAQAGNQLGEGNRHRSVYSSDGADYACASFFKLLLRRSYQATKAPIATTTPPAIIHRVGSLARAAEIGTLKSSGRSPPTTTTAVYTPG